ncbi:MAG TPA: CHAT domain-containing protein [Herpetosiphonaceae bacterium]
MTVKYNDVEIAIDAAREGAYPIRVRLANGQQFRDTFKLPAPLAAYQHPRANLPAVAQPVAEGDVFAFGIALRDLLITDEVRAALHTAARIAQPGQAIRLRLLIEPEAKELSAIPWEYLADSVGHPLATYYSFCRALPQPQPIQIPTLPPNEALRILIVSALPNTDQGTNGFAPQREAQAVRLLAEQIPWHSPLQLAIVDRTTPAMLNRAIKTHRPHIVHFIGLGDEQGPLLFENDRQERQPLSALALSVALKHPELLLVILMPCAGRSAPGGPRLAEELTRAAIPAVVTMPTPLEGVDARASFIQAFYGALALGADIDECVMEGRKALVAQGSFDWGLATLYTRTQDAMLFHAKAREAAPARPQPRRRPTNPQEFLEAHGFQFHHDYGDLFTTKAETEREATLSASFVTSSLLEVERGRTSKREFNRLLRPESAMVFAPHGYGKTAHRLQLARRLESHVQARALTASFTNFDTLHQAHSQAEGTRRAKPLIQRYPEIVIQKVLESIEAKLRNPQCQDRLRRNEQAYIQLISLQDAFGRPITPLEGHDRYADRISRQRENIERQKEDFGFSGWLAELTKLAEAFDFPRICFLIDRVGEWPEAKRRPADAISLLQPFLSPAILQPDCAFSFKFFLPDWLEAPLRAHGLPQSLPVYRLDWTPEALIEMLQRRFVAHFQDESTMIVSATNDTADAFWRLCDVPLDADIEARLLAAARGVPFSLIKLIQAIIERHCEHSYDPHSLISNATLREVCDQWPSSHQD